MDADELRAIERSRLRSLAEPDLELARQLHAADYQLVTPTGTALSKEQYLGRIESGALVYRVFEPVSEIAVRGGAGHALLRYQARISIEEGEHLAEFACWHLDSYELIDGRWLAVWSQATKTARASRPESLATEVGDTAVDRDDSAGQVAARP